MLSYELMIGIANTIILAIGFFFSIRQISILIKTHSDNHDWNRRIATQEALSLFNQIDFVNDLKELSQILLFSELKHPISLPDLKLIFKENPKVRTQCHTLLNFYESLARGIKFGIYDEAIIENSRRALMERAYTILEEYIKYRRNEFSASAWNESTELLRRWKEKETTQGKKQIGKI